jgi:hypothetical protein
MIVGAEECVQALRGMQHVIVGTARTLMIVIVLAWARQFRELGIELIVGGRCPRRRGTVGGVERDRRRARKRRAHQRDGTEDIRPDQRAPRRNRRAGVVAHDCSHGPVTQRINEPGRVPHHVENPERVGIGVKRTIPSCRTAVAALIGCNHVVAGLRERQQHLAPAVGELREAVQQQQARASGGLVACLQHMHHQAIVVVDDSRANL